MENHLVPLAPGTRAPDFSLRQTPGLTFSLRRLLGRPLVLAFYPAAFEPVSREQLTLYEEFLPSFTQLNAQLLGVSSDHTWSQEAFAGEAGITFPLLADTPPRGQVSRLYGVYRQHKDTTGRALFVVDPAGTIRFGEAYPDALNPGVDGLLTMLESLDREGVALP